MKKSKAIKILDSNIGSEANPGDNLRAIRRSLYLTQKEFAKKLKISVTTLSSIESNKRYPSNKTIQKILKALKLEKSQFLQKNEKI